MARTMNDAIVEAINAGVTDRWAKDKEIQWRIYDSGHRFKDFDPGGLPDLFCPKIEWRCKPPVPAEIRWKHLQDCIPPKDSWVCVLNSDGTLSVGWNPVFGGTATHWTTLNGKFGELEYECPLCGLY